VLRCETGHSFDLAREGYVNLLVGKRPAITGDSAAMIAARRAFLARGHYAPLVQAVAGAAAGAQPQVVADAGCGEGYYLGALAGTPEFSGARFYGTDISKPAIVAAAKAYPGMMFAVADTNGLLPFADHSVDVLIDVFAPRNAGEFARVVRPGGRLVVAIPGADHLAELRTRFHMLAIEPNKAEKIVSQMAGFVLEGRREVRASFDLSGEALQELVGMTPSIRHLDEEGRRALTEAGVTTAHAQFEVLAFSRA